MLGRSILSTLAGRMWFPAVLTALMCAAPGALGTDARKTAVGRALDAHVPFVANEGQLSDSSVMFYARTFGGTVYVTREGRIVYAFPRFESCDSGRDLASARRPSGASVFSETLVGGFQDVVPEGVGRSGTRVNWYAGNDPDRWHTDIPSFETLSLGEVYEGIELALRAYGNNVEKIFTVAPGADPCRIGMRVDGVESVAVMPGGELELATALGPVRFTAPIAYQDRESGVDSVQVAYRVEGDVVRFELGDYDANRPLVIDPLVASTFLGGGNDDVIRAMGMHSWSDAGGGTNIFVAGWTASPNFPVTLGPTYQGTGNFDAFVSKFDDDLEELLASTFLGGSSNDMIYALAVDDDGNIAVAGYTESEDFPSSHGEVLSGGGSAFVTVFSTHLALFRSTLLGGDDIDKAYAVAFGAGSSIYVAGCTASTDFPTTTGAFMEDHQGLNDAFVVRFSADLGTRQVSTYIGGAEDDEAHGMVVSGDHVFIAGHTLSDDFPETAGRYQTTRRGGKDMFIARLGLDLDSAISTYLGGTSDDAAYAIALEPGGGVVVAGYTESGNFPVWPSGNEIAPGYTNQPMAGKDAVVAWLHGDLNAREAATYIAGDGDEVAYDIYIDAESNIHVTGYTASTNFPVTPNAYDTLPNGGRDVFLSSFEGSLDALSVSTYLGGGFDDEGFAVIQTPDAGYVFVAGATDSGNFPRTLQAYEQFPGPDYMSGFVSKFVKHYAYGTEKWRFSVEFGPLAAESGPTFDMEGSILLLDNYARLYSLDRSGAPNWPSHIQLANPFVEHLMQSYPAVDADGTIHVCSRTNLYTIDGGAVVATNSFGAGVYSSPAVGTNGVVYVATFGTPPKLCAVDAGGLLWESDLVGAFFAWASPVIDSEGFIYVASHSAGADPAFLYKFDPGGNEIWRGGLSTNTYSSPAIGADGDIYISNRGRLLCFNPDDESRNWTNHLAGVSTGYEEYSSPVIGGNGTVYIGQSDRLFGVDGATGGTNMIWNLGGQVHSSAAIGEHGSIYVGSGSNLYSLHPDGPTNWMFETGGNVGRSSPLIAADGTIYIAGGTNLFAVWGREALADTPWPMYHHDQMRTRNAALGPVPPEPPDGVWASIHSNDHIRVTWEPVPGAAHYEVWRAETAESEPEYLGIAGGDFYKDTYVPVGYNYYYWVRAYSAMLAGELSSPGVLGGRPTIPPAPVEATRGFPEELYRTNALVSWPASSGTQVGYHVYRGVDDDTNNAVLIDYTTDTNVTDSAENGMIPGVTNFYWVSSHNLTTTSAWSEAAWGGIAPSAPTNQAATQGTITNYVAITWDPPPGSPDYRIHRGTSTNFPASESLDDEVIGTVYEDGEEESVEPVPFRTYYYWVLATNQFGLSVEGDGVAGHRALHPPLGASASDGTFSNYIKVSWTVHTTNPVSYSVYRNTVNEPGTADWRANISYIFEDEIRTNYNDLEITRGLEYYYWVTAVNPYGESEFSPHDTGGTKPLAPLDVTVSAGEFVDRVRVTWDGATGASGYRIYRGESVDPGAAVQVGTSATTLFDDMDAVAPGVRYFYWVKSTNVYGTSIFSGFDSGWRDLAPPSGVTASDGVFTSHVEVAWNPVENATHYDVWRNTEPDPGTARELMSGLDTTVCQDVDATVGQIYYYWVRARNVEFTGGLSDYDSGYRSLGNLDIGVSGFIFQPPVMAAGGRPAAVSFRVTNHGADDMFDPNYWVSADFYISENPVFGSGLVNLGRVVRRLSLDAGESASVTLTPGERSRLRIPAGTLGTRHVFVHIDHVPPSTWIDPNQNNNTASRFGGPIDVRETAPAPFTVSDFTGDGKADLALYHEESGGWFVSRTDGTVILWNEEWGGIGCRPVVGDFDGSGTVDMAVYHEATGTWYIRRLDGSLILWAEEWGGPGFSPVWGDYSGDGIADLCVYHEESGMWFARTVDGRIIVWNLDWGGPGSMQAPGDYDGDGRCDFAVFYDGVRNWFIRSMSGAVPAWGLEWGGYHGFVPVPGDYSGDGLADLAVYHAPSGYWFIRSLAGEYLLWGEQWGGHGFTPVTGDFDGDGRDDMALYHEETGAWYVRTVDGRLILWAQPWGGPGLKPMGPGL